LQVWLWLPVDFDSIHTSPTDPPGWVRSENWRRRVAPGYPGSPPHVLTAVNHTLLTCQRALLLARQRLSRRLARAPYHMGY